MDSLQVCQEHLVPALPGCIVHVLPVIDITQEGMDVLLPRFLTGIIAPWGSSRAVRTCCHSRLTSATNLSRVCTQLSGLQVNIVSRSVARSRAFLDWGLPWSKVCSQPGGSLYILLEHAGASLEHTGVSLERTGASLEHG